MFSISSFVSHGPVFLNFLLVAAHGKFLTKLKQKSFSAATTPKMGSAASGFLTSAASENNVNAAMIYVVGPDCGNVVRKSERREVDKMSPSSFLGLVSRVAGGVASAVI